MQNKLRKIKTFTILLIFLLTNSVCYSIEKAQISTLIHNYYGPTADIERLFRQNINIEPPVKYTIVPRGLIVSIDSPVFFEDGKDEILETSKPVLAEIAEILKSLNNDCIVEGNTEIDTFENSKYKSNWELSMARADKIADYLIKFENVNPNRIKSIGFGELKPMPAYTKIVNDRIDFIIINYEPIKPIN